MTAASLALAVAMATAAGVVGCFAVMRRMTLASDALSHVALPGIGLALLANVHPALGAAAALGLGTLLVWALEHKTRIATETVIGVVFSAALAAGSLLASGEELIDALLGKPATLSPIEVALGISAAVAVSAFILWKRDALVVSMVSPDIARTAGIDVARLDLAFLLAFAATVALGLRYLGVLLMGSLVIIPAATAKYLARGLPSMIAISVGVAVVSTVAGTLLAPRLHQPPGPIIIAVAAAFFFFGLLRPRRG